MHIQDGGMHAAFDQNKSICYIVRVNTKRDWLICGNVISDKCNVSRRATSVKLLGVANLRVKPLELSPSS